MLEQIEAVLRSDGLVAEGWATDMRTWGNEIAEYRRYYDGDHRVSLSEQMKQMLRSQAGFSDNYCELIVNTMVDRLLVTSINGNDDTAREWASELMDVNRFDALQLDVHEAVVRDGDTFVLAEYEDGRVNWYQEPAWDNSEGVIVVYGKRRRKIVAAVKIWLEVDTYRVNIYYENRVVKYEAVSSADTDTTAVTLRLVEELPWQAKRVPIVHFKNRTGTRSRLGKSELKAAIPINDMLNRTLISMIMTSELNGFPIRIARGWKAPDTVAPGQWLSIAESGLEAGVVADAFTLDNGEVLPYIQQANFLIDQMGTITLTLLPSLMGGLGESGEAIKEREKGFVGKVKRAQVRFGNAWEDVLKLSGDIEAAYGRGGGYAGVRWSVQWQDAQTRNDTELVANAIAVRELVGDRETLRQVGRVFQFDEDKIEALLAERQAEASSQLAALGGSLPGFEAFGGG